ncbi:A/G-specific adenine glycosylase [Hydrogenimonas sp.]|uniref:A/G-specific adenine glycosylase n=1 Tax=Hydrogenimonas sp. TaxID=2231112 RepID=UPI002613C564|nr:A/G-specific adenine glycosylase [Hydrogenimonas sp.]
MNYSDIHTAIREWYATNGRHDLPWRNTDDPYIIYISEMMLQQTQVKTVLDRHFHPFLKRFPTLRHIKEAKLDDVLHAWQGLGYYRRARYIYATAQIAAPKLPTDPAELVKLPGIGKSTAHAIAAFSSHRPVAVLDANVKRILCRFFAKKSAAPKALWEMAEVLLDRKEPYIYNQAMMDIGSTVCTPKSPSCHLCPLQSGCMGQSDPIRFPQKRVKKPRPVRYRKLACVRNETGLLMRQRKGELLGGLWELPELDEMETTAEKIGEVTHEYSHFKLVAELYESNNRNLPGTLVTYENLTTIPTSSLEKKIFEKLKLL